MRSALVAVDGSDASVAAIHAARRLLGPDAHLVVVHVAELVPMTPPVAPGIAPVAAGVAMHPDPEESVRSAAEIARRTLDDASVDGPLGPAEAIGAVGEPADTIIELADARAVDVIAVGSHEHGWLTKLFTRSVAAEVRERAHVPVLVVPAPGRHHPDG